MRESISRFCKRSPFAGRFRKLRLKTKLLCYFLVLITIPLIGIGYFSYFFTGKVIVQNTSQNVNGILAQANETVEYYLHDLVNVAAVLNVNEQFINLIRKENEPLSQFEKIKNEYEISQILSNTINTKREIYSIALFTQTNMYFSGASTQESMRRTEWFKAVQENRVDKLFIANNSFTVSNAQKYVYSLAYGLKDIKGGNRIGVIVVSLDDRVIRNVLDKIDFAAKSSIFLLDQDNKIAYGNGNNLSKSIDSKTLDLIKKKNGQAIETINGDRYFIIMHTSAYSNWSIVWFIPYKTLVAKATEIRDTIFLITFICIVIAFIISISLSSNITTPINRFMLDMNRVEQGDLNVRVNYGNFLEIGKLSDSFNNMISEIKDLIDKVYREQNAKRRAEIKVLETQINPHFLYNTLDSIKWVAILQKADNVGSMITNLVRLLQISLSGGNEFIDVAHEIEHVKNYLEIQKFRYNDRFNVVFRIDDEILPYKTLKIMLQPLVENALFYGIEPKKAKGTITITGGIEGGSLLFTVEDDGVGIDCSSVEELLDRRDNSKNRMYKGMGIKNIDERIKLYFGGEYGLEFASEPNVGTRVKIRMPLIGKEEK